MALNAVKDVAKFINGKAPDGVHIDNALFRLHYRVTTTIFLASSALLATTGLFGKPVNCHHADPDRISNDVVDTYCWVTSTYTLPHQLAKSDQYPFSDIAFQGVGAHTPGDEKKYHTYYQWVSFALFLQGMAFFLPHWLWRFAEGRRLASILQNMTVPVLDAEDRGRRIVNTVQYLLQTMGSYNGYFFRYIACELLNVANVVANIFITDRFLGGEFLSYGPRMLAFFAGNHGDGASPMTVTFPKVTKCNFQLIGASGSVQTVDSICVMALNILNDKIYLLLWFWLVALAVISILALAWRVVMMSATALRVPMLRRTAQLADARDLEDLAERVRLGDFFLFCQLAMNMDGVAFRQLMAELARSLSKGPFGGEGAVPRAPPSEPSNGTVQRTGAAAN